MLRTLFALLLAATSISLAAGAAIARPATQLAIPTGVWQLQAIVDGDGNEMVPANPAAYTLQFVPGDGSDEAGGIVGGGASGLVELGLDCNTGSAAYTLDGVQLKLTDFISTMAACPEPTLAKEYEDALRTVTFFVVEGDTLTLFFRDGSLRFVQVGGAPAEEVPAEEVPAEDVPAEATPVTDSDSAAG